MTSPKHKTILPCNFSKFNKKLQQNSLNDSLCHADGLSACITKQDLLLHILHTQYILKISVEM